MPIIKQAIKRMKQDRTKRMNNRHYASRMKSMIKLFLEHIGKNETDKAKKLLPEVVKTIDTAAKKNIIHRNNAAHKKSRVQRALSAVAGKAKTAPAPKTELKEA